MRVTVSQRSTGAIAEGILHFTGTVAVQQWSIDAQAVLLTVSPADVFTQLALHEVHHRSQLMAMLRQLAQPVEDVDYSYLMYKREEIRAS